MVVAGLEQGLFLISVMAFAAFDVPPQAGATAAGLFNLTRVIGTAIASASVGFVLRLRENFHSAMIVENLSNANPSVSSRLARQGTTQAYVLAFGDVFLIISEILLAFGLLILRFLKYLKARDFGTMSRVRTLILTLAEAIIVVTVGVYVLRFRDEFRRANY